jgi:hypothetical protein
VFRTRQSAVFEELVPIARLAVLRILDLEPTRHRRHVVHALRPLGDDAFKVPRAAAGGQYELFKTSARFDGTARNPLWLG